MERLGRNGIKKKQENKTSKQKNTTTNDNNNNKKIKILCIFPEISISYIVYWPSNRVFTPIFHKLNTQYYFLGEFYENKNIK